MLASLHTLAQVWFNDALRLIFVLRVLPVACDILVFNDRLSEATVLLVHGINYLTRSNDRLLCVLSHALRSLQRLLNLIVYFVIVGK